MESEDREQRFGELVVRAVDMGPILNSVLQRFAKADVDVVHGFLAKSPLCELPIETTDAEPVDRLKRYVTEPRADVVMDAHAVVARHVGTNVVARRKPVLKVGSQGASAPLDAGAVNDGRLQSVHCGTGDGLPGLGVNIGRGLVGRRASGAQTNKVAMPTNGT